MAKIIGIKKVEYDKKDGNHVSGYEFVYAFPSKYYEGVNVDRCFVYGNTISEYMGGVLPKIGDEVEFTYGKSRDGKAYINGYKIAAR